MALMQAAHYLHTTPWELAERPDCARWIAWAMAALEVESIIHPSLRLF